MTGSLSRARRADRAGVARHVAPAERLLPLLDRDAHAQLLAAQAQRGVVREEAHGDGVVARRRQLELELRAREAAQQPVGHLQHQAGAVARIGVGTARSAVLHRGQHRERALDHLAAAHAVGTRDQAEAAGVVLEAAIVKRVLFERLHLSRLPED